MWVSHRRGGRGKKAIEDKAEARDHAREHEGGKESGKDSENDIMTLVESVRE